MIEDTGLPQGRFWEDAERDAAEMKQLFPRHTLGDVATLAGGLGISIQAACESSDGKELVGAAKGLAAVLISLSEKIGALQTMKRDLEPLDPLQDFWRYAAMQARKMEANREFSTIADLVMLHADFAEEMKAGKDARDLEHVWVNASGAAHCMLVLVEKIKAECAATESGGHDNDKN